MSEKFWGASGKKKGYKTKEDKSKTPHKSIG